ncbi:uncharacterized protein LOC142644019 [Castanea sativa]|uniref:uncharacterized protein LOC142644019 n=1 Tax=Castanea sativa TaxID=21020 RepID=UPI003F652C2F
MSKRKIIDAFFKKKDVSDSEIRTPVAVETNVDTSMSDEHPSKCSRIQSEEIDRDPGSRKDSNSPHRIVVKCCKHLKNYSRYIDKLIEKQTLKELENNRLRLKTSIECARWLAFQACAFRDHYESLDSKNRGNFIELIKFTSTFNDKVASVVLENAPRNANYTSPTIQKEILHIIASNVRNAIHEKIGDEKFCILVNEARDEPKREQITIILKFVDKNGFIKERFFHVVHVRDITVLTLKNEICAVLSRYNLYIENIRGQGYDGASNMRGEWNGLQALFLKECLYAYYVHCMAHKFKSNDELQYAQGEQIENMIASNEIETRRGANQIVSIATTERAFSVMKLLKTRLCNRMEDEFLADNMIVYIEKKIAGNFTMEMIMDEFYSMKNRRQT